MKTLLIFALTLITSIQVFATAQYPDKIIYKGKEFSLLSNPLEVYFEKYPDKRPKNEIMSSALWRGYVATFEIRDSQLFLKDIEVEISDTLSKDKFASKWESIMNKVFPDTNSLKVDWMTGLLVLPYGKTVNYVHMGYASTYENYVLLEVSEGNLLKEKEFTNEQYEIFREKQFQAFKKTDKYKELKRDLKKDGSSDSFIDEFLKIFVIDYTSKILIDD